MKVRVTLLIEVNEDAWREDQGTDGPVALDVREYVLNAIQQAPAPFGAVRLVANRPTHIGR